MSRPYTPVLSTAFLLRIFFFLFLLISCFNNASATHLAGGDIEYECIGPRTWKIRLVVYKLCGPSSADLCFSFSCPQNMTATPSATIANGGLNPNGCTASPSSVPITLQLVKVEDAEKSRLERCGTIGKNNCTNLGAVAAGPYTPGVERYTFEGTLNLNLPSLNPASSCPYWDIAWDFCCRNSTENVQSQPGFHIEATINIFDQTTTPCVNNSPLLKQEAIISFCAGMEHIFNLGAVDPDRDSLSYEIMKSMQAANTPVNYNPGYNERRPFPLVASLPPHNQFPGSPFVVLDTLTGDLALNPLNVTTQPIAGDLSVRIKQWRYREEPAGSGIMKPYIVGVTMRNLQIMSVPCPGNNAPRFTTNPTLPNGKPKYDWTVCAGEQVCFTITAKDTDYRPQNFPPLIDSTWISWSKAIERPANKLSFSPDTLSVQRAREDRWKFCWQTDIADGSDLPYYFTVRADDSRCPNPGKVIQTFSIRVLLQPQADLVKENLACGKWAIHVRKTRASQTLSSALLEVARTPYDKFFSNGIDSTVSPDPNPPGTGSSPRMIISDTVQFTQPGLYFVRYTVSVPGLAGTFCTRVFYDSLLVDTVLKANASADVFKCQHDSLLLTGSAIGGNAPYSYRWYRNNTQGTPINGPNFQLNNAISIFDTLPTRFILRVQDVSGCMNLDTVEVKVKLLNPALILVNDTDQCIASNQFKFSHGSISNFTNYTRSWTSENFTSGDSTFTVNYATPGTKNVRLIISETGGCSDTVSLHVNVSATPAVSGVIQVNDSDQCVTGNAFAYSYAALPGHTYKWILDNGSTSVVPVLIRSYTTAGIKTIKLEVKNAGGCVDTASKTVVVTSELVLAPINVSSSLQCVTSNSFTFSHSFEPGLSYHWFYDNNVVNTDSVLVRSYTTPGVKTVQLVAEEPGGCTAAVSKNVVVGAKPVVNNAILVNDSTQCLNNNNFVFTYSVFNNPTLFTHTWYNNGTLTQATSLPVSYSASGSQTIQLIITQPGACTDTATRTVLVGDMPVVQGVVSVSDTIQCLTGNSFTFTYNKPNTTQNRFLWLINGDTSSVSPLQYSFKSAGVKAIQLGVASDGGCVDTTEKMYVTVKPSPASATVQGPLTSLLAQHEYDYNIGSPQLGHTYKWYVNNGSFVHSDDSVFVRIKWLAVGPGSLKVEQTLNGCTDVDSIAVSIGSVGIKNSSSLQNIFVKPNPNKGVFTIGLESTQIQPVQATLHNVLGELVWSKEQQMSTGSNELEVNVNVSNGIYLLTVYDRESKTVKRVLINR